MRKKLKKYKVGLDSATYAISLVESPAIEEDFIYMSEKEPIKVQMSSDEKHMLYGAVLIPDKSIYRVADDGEEYYLEFSRESIEKMSQDFFRENRNHNFTLSHEDDASELCVVESWIKEDLYKDKSVALGLSEDLPLGSWIIGCKVNNVDTWKKIKNGQYKGFSVESLIHLEDFSKQEETINMESDMGAFMDSIKTMIQDALNPQTTTITEEPSQTVEEPAQETSVEAIETTSEASKDNEVSNDTSEEKETIVESEIKSEEENHLQEVIQNLKAELEALKKQNSTLNDKVKELEKEPSAKPINTQSGQNKGSSYDNWRNQMQNLLR